MKRSKPSTKSPQRPAQSKPTAQPSKARPQTRKPPVVRTDREPAAPSYVTRDMVGGSTYNSRPVSK